jgi:diaminopimelate epimerase
MKIDFTKMHALGNNYIYVNLFNEKDIPEHTFPDLARKVANVRTGIGSDGLITIGPSQSAAVKMRIFNADGSEAESCGNGLRCVARYVYDHKLAGERTFSIETLGGLVQAEVVEDPPVVTVDMGTPRLTKGELPMLGDPQESSEHIQLKVQGGHYDAVGISMGNPHIVMFVDDIHNAPVAELGPRIEEHEAFPNGVNVEFIRVVNERELDFRVWERGSGITYACGTGACAAVVAAILKGHCRRGEKVTVHLLGGDLDIVWHRNGHVFMTGPSEYVCSGQYWLKN